MNERLESLLKRYDELSLMIQDADLVKDQNKYKSLMKEYSQLAAIHDLYAGIAELAAQISDTRVLIQD